MSAEPAPRNLLLRLLVGLAGVFPLLRALALVQQDQWLLAAAAFAVGVLCVGWSLPRSRGEGKQLWQSVLDQQIEAEERFAEQVEAADAVRAQCPCCGFPALVPEDTDLECLLCEWDASESEAVFPLAEARQNFSHFASVYPPAFRPPWSRLPPTAAEKTAAQELIRSYQTYREADPSERRQRWLDVLEAEGVLAQFRQQRAEHELESRAAAEELPPA